MLKQSVRAVVLFLSFLTSVASVNAQSTQRFKVDVPFQFVLNGQTLTAGKYVIERTDPAKPNIVTLKRDGGILRVIITQRVERDNPSTASSLIFIRREGKHYLFQIWNVGAMNGNQVPSAHGRERNNRQPTELTLVTLKANGN
jgi:hypothetical protein